ncbi:hypothetical protein BH11MYX2_BH11MYX2_31130 [soil metagenome]
MSHYSNDPSSSVRIIESVGQDLARETLPRAKRYSDRPMDLRLERPSVVIDEPELVQVEPLPVTTRMRRIS